MPGTGGDAITLLEVIDPYEITMVAVEENMVTSPLQKDGVKYGAAGPFYISIVGSGQNEIYLKICFWQARSPWVTYLSDL